MIRAKVLLFAHLSNEFTKFETSFLGPLHQLDWFQQIQTDEPDHHQAGGGHKQVQRVQVGRRVRVHLLPAVGGVVLRGPSGKCPRKMTKKKSQENYLKYRCNSNTYIKYQSTIISCKLSEHFVLI